MRKPFPMCRPREDFFYPSWRQPSGPFTPMPGAQTPSGSAYGPQSIPPTWVPPIGSATAFPAALADQVDPGEDTMAYTTACKGWIAVKTHYHEFDHIAVGGEVNIYKIEDGVESLVHTQKVDYKTVAQNTDFIIPVPMPRPEEIPERQPIDVPFVKHPPERPPGVPQSAPPYEDDSFPIELDIEEISIPQVLYQAPEVAIENGNPSLLFGGEDGFDPGEYIVKFKPKITHGKLRVDPTPLEAGDGAGMAGRYVIIPGHGAPPNEHTTANTTDQYLQVPDSTTVEEEWSQRIIVGCSKPETPSVAEFIWTDFKTWQPISNKRIRLTHPKARHGFWILINKTEEVYDETWQIQDDVFRTIEEQNEKFNLGLSNARGGDSYHNYGLAVDVVLKENGNPIFANDALPIALRAHDWYSKDPIGPVNWKGISTVGEYCLGLGWGMRFTSLWDPGHFQRDVYTERELLRMYNSKQTFSYDGDGYGGKYVEL